MRTASRFGSQLVSWFCQNRRDLPWRRSRSAYGTWISEVMLQQTQVKTVIPYWERWMREMPTVASLAAAPEARVLKLWEGLGYYSRARNLQKAARQIVAEHNGEFPSSFDAILNLPGVGRYTAGAISSIAFGLPTPIVDGNVARVFTRCFALKGDPKSKPTSAALWAAATELVSAAHAENACGDLNEALMELGATICMPRAPLCGRCPIQSRCAAYKTKQVERFPEISARPAATQRTFHAFLIRKKDLVLLRQRPNGVVNAGFWELPNSESFDENPATAASALGATNSASKPLCVIKHTITRYRMTLKVFAASPGLKPSGKWLKPEELHQLPLVNAHRKVLYRVGLLEPRSTQAGKVLMETCPT